MRNGSKQNAMTSRSQILGSVLANQPAFTPVGDPPLLKYTAHMTLVEEFCHNLSAISVNINLLDHIQPLLDEIQMRVRNGDNIVSNLRSASNHDTWRKETAATDPGLVETVYMRSYLAVAENGAVWIDDSNVTHRILPFFCDNLKLVINASSIVRTLHDAYMKIDFTAIGFGTFIAGPSKTADIEQSLVIGAHGAKSCAVYILLND